MIALQLNEIIQIFTIGLLYGFFTGSGTSIIGITVGGIIKIFNKA